MSRFSKEGKENLERDCGNLQRIILFITIGFRPFFSTNFPKVSKKTELKAAFQA
jgi:hypothetical protein